MRVNSEGGAAAWLAGTLLAPSVSLCHRSYGPMRVFSQAFCSWGSEGLFGISFSIALPIQALKGLPCLGPFSVVRCIRHIEGPPLAGILLCSSVLQVFDGPAQLSIAQRLMQAYGEREAMVMAPPPRRDSAGSPCFHGCLTFVHRHLPPQTPP